MHVSRGKKAYYLIITVFLYSSPIYWILCALVVGNMVLTAIDAAFKELETVRAERKNEVKRFSLTIIDYAALAQNGLHRLPNIAH